MRGHLNECLYKHPFNIDINDQLYLNIYPDPNDKVHLKVKENIANYVKVKSDNVTLTAGADDSIALIINSLPNARDRVIYKYSPAYMFLDSMCNTIYHVETPIKDRYKAMELYNPPNGSIIYICNPCNPTNDLWDRSEYLYLCNKYPECIIIIDEAYMDFHDMEHSYNHINEYKNLFYVRTFSKLFGIADLRLGYFIHNKDFLTSYYCFKKITNISKSFANKIFEHIDFYKNIKLQIDYVKNKLGSHSPTNFIFLHSREEDLDEIKQFALENNLLLRFGYGNAVRISLQVDTNIELIRNIIDKYDVLPDIRELYTSIDTRIELVNLFRKFMEIADKNNIIWWVDGGTRIGAERHQAIIPWDDDIDIGIHHEDMESIADTLRPYFNVKKNTTTDQYYQICSNTFDGHPRDSYHIDIFPFSKTDNKYIHVDSRFRHHVDGMGNFDYTDSELLPLRYVNFYDFTVPVPQQKLPDIFNQLEIRKDNELIYKSSKLVLS